MTQLTLTILPNKLAIVRLNHKEKIPTWLSFENATFFSITKTTDELSIVCDEFIVPPQVACVKSWKAFKVEGPLDFSLTGILASLANPLAANGISIFAVSTYDTDYILVKESDLEAATESLKKEFSIVL